MRLNVFIAQASGLSRRSADKAIEDTRVFVNGNPPEHGYKVKPDDVVTLDGDKLSLSTSTTTIMLHKPVGYVCSRNGQGNRTIYNLLPPGLHHLKPIGRLDKDTSGLLLLTTDGQLANQLTQPRYQKNKVYQVQLDKPLTDSHQQMISNEGIMLDDGLSKLEIECEADKLTIVMQEGRNRQIRRTFESLGYKVKKLHRIAFGDYTIGSTKPGQFIVV